jgi:ABC-type antimicrobial peptide transport system permease subunit
VCLSPGRERPNGELEKEPDVYVTYIWRELRRRYKQSIVVALGLGVGVGLVVTVSSAAAGVRSAQGQVLHSLYGVGTDMTVTKSLAPGTGGPQRFRGFGAGPPPGQTRRLARDVLRPQPGTATLAASTVAKVEAVNGVSAASGGLVLTDTVFSGAIPSAGGGFRSGGSSSSPSFSLKTFTVDGVEIGPKAVGPLTASQVTTGRYFNAADSAARLAIVSTTYARQHSLHVGSKITVAGKPVRVIGLAAVSSGSADVFVPLRTAQKLAGLTGKVTTIFVSAASASQVSSAAAAVKAALPNATVSTSATLADQVSGALSSAATLTSSLGRWLSIAALAVAFVVAGLLMMAAVSRRVREFGTLKAIGWRTRRVVAQVVGEGLALGILGGVAGLVLGIAAAAAISAVAPSLTATVGSTFATAGSFGPFGGAAGPRPFGGAQSVLVHLTAPLQTHTIIVALLLALAGGLVAGGFGAWRAARLRPADALRSVG